MSNSAYDTAVLADSPVAYWTLDDARGSTTAADLTGNGHAGTVGSALVLGTPSLVPSDGETAATLPGINDSTGRVSVPNSAAFSTTGPVTVECWVDLAAIPGGNARLFSVGVAGTSGYGAGLENNGKLLVTAYGVADVTSSYVIGTRAVVYLVYVIDPGSGHILFYVNGTMHDSEALASLVAASTTICIGNSANGSESGVNGVVQKVAVYGTALSATRITAHWTAATSGGGLLLRGVNT